MENIQSIVHKNCIIRVKKIDEITQDFKDLFQRFSYDEAHISNIRFILQFYEHILASCIRNNSNIG